MEFTHFVEDDKNSLQKCTAVFNLPSRVAQFIPLDDEEAFGSMLLSVHLRGVDRAEAAITAFDDPATRTYVAPVALSSIPATNSISMAAIGRAPTAFDPNGNGTPASTPPSSSSPSSRPRFSFSLSLAEGLDRLYRSWFETILPPSDIYTPPASPTLWGYRPTLPQVLSPSGSCGLLEARIQCQQSTRYASAEKGCGVAYPYMPYGSPGSYTAGQPKLFEFYYTDLLLDVSFISQGSQARELILGHDRLQELLWV